MTILNIVGTVPFKQNTFFLCFNQREEKFSPERLYAGEFVVHMLAGQHICLADKHMLETLYKDTSPGSVPSIIVHKNTDIYFNLTMEERQTFVVSDIERSYK